MIRVVMYFLTLAFLLVECVPSNHSYGIGDYYLCYKNGVVLSESDSSSQVYIRLHGDGTYIIKDAKSIEQGRWKTIDYDDFSITYFYSSYLNSVFRTGEIGQCAIVSASLESDAKVLARFIWYGPGKLKDDSFDQFLFCQQDKILIKENLNEMLKWSYGSNLKQSPISGL